MNQPPRLVSKTLSLANSNAIFGALAFLGLFCTVFFTRFFNIVTSPIFIDPWVGLGYGQTFPETAYQWHYYKESRIFHSLLTHLLLIDVEFITYSIRVCIIVSIAAILLFSAMRIFSIGRVLSILFCLVFAVTPWMWGDNAGGLDYYNTFGNCYLASSLLLLCYSLNNKNQKVYALIGIGMLLSLITMEVPSGILYTAWALFTIFIYELSQQRQEISLAKITYKFSMILAGSLAFFVIEILILRVLGESPSRITTGIRTLADIVLQRESQKMYWRELDLFGFLTTPGVSSFSALLLILVCALSINFKHEKFRKNQHGSQAFAISCSSVVIAGLVLMLQVSGKTIALTTSYFAIPLLFVLLFAVALNICILTYEYSKTNWLLCACVLIVVLPIFYIDSHILIFTILFVALTFALIINPKTRLDSFLFVCSIMLIISTTNLAVPNRELIESRNKCETSRFEWRKTSLKFMDFIDQYTQNRAQIVMGVEPSLFESRVNKAKCIEFQNFEVVYFVATLSYQGITTANNLGSLSLENPLLKKYGYRAEILADAKSRSGYTKDVCLLEWAPSIPKNVTPIVSLDINQEKFFGYSKCALFQKVDKGLVLEVDV